MKKTKFWKVLFVMAACILMFSSCIAGAKVSAPAGLRVPALAYDSSSVWLFWERPAKGEQVSYYNVYANGRLIGNTKLPPATIGTEHIQKFQAENEVLSDNLIAFHSYKAEGLQPDTAYGFMVRAVGINGLESADSSVVSQRTTIAAEVIKLTDFGAVGDGTTVNTAAIQKAINACPTDGILEVPSGTFVTGAVNLKSNMTMQLDAGAVLLSVNDVNGYTMGFNNRYIGMLNADGLRNIRIVGKGVIDGNGWQKDRMDRYYLKAKNKENKGAINTDHVRNIGILAKTQTEALLNEGRDFKSAYAGRSTTLIFHDVSNLYFEGITLQNPSMHMLSTGGCNNVTLNNVKIMTYDCNNGDGIDFSGQNLLVANSYFDTGDDDVNFDAGMGLKAAAKPPVSGIWVFNTYFSHGHGAVVCGSHTGSWIQNVLAEDNVMENTEIGLRCKTGQGVGGGARDITFRNNIMKAMKRQAFVFTTAYTDANAVGDFEQADAGQFHDIVIEDCNVDGTGGPAIEVDGLEEMPHKNITFRNIHFTNVQPNKSEYLENGVFDHITYDT